MTKKNVGPDIPYPSDGHLWVADVTRFPTYPGACEVANVPDIPLPDIPSYVCHKVKEPIVIDGRLNEDAWSRAQWSESFGAIDSGRKDGRETNVALLWDDQYLYGAYRVQDFDVRGTMSGHHEHVYICDDDVEIFVEGPNGYYEVGVNPINNIYELKWTWLEQIISANNSAELDKLLRLSDRLYYAPRRGEKYGRIGDMGWELPGIRHAVQVDGILNNPETVDVGWTVEFALPWAGLSAVGLPAKPSSGQQFRVQGYRALHDREDLETAAKLELQYPGATPFRGYTWSTMGNGNVHNPERWVSIELSDTVI
jgi:hypothetical protein